MVTTNPYRTRAIAIPEQMWSRIQFATLQELDARAVSLNVGVSTIVVWGGKGTIEVRAFSRRPGPVQMVSVRGTGGLAAMYAAVLDDFEEEYPVWTPEELVAIASQSGIEVQRA